MKLPNLIFIFYILLAGCANITTPTGGPKDIIPPETVFTIPEDKQTNFKGKSIVLEFDEYVKLNNAKEEIIISPSPGKDVQYKLKGKRVTVTPAEPWKDTTTYSIRFREGIQDITEGNSPLNLKIAFSTGDKIDSISVNGKITDLLTGEPIEKVTVAIYPQDTFNIVRDSPNYFTRTNKRGVFLIENIKSGDYHIYAFDDKNKNLKLETRNERFGFISKKLSLQENIDSLRIGMIKLDTRKPKINTIRTIGSVTRLKINKEVVSFKIKDTLEITSGFGINQSEINIWYPETREDSLKISLSVIDSLNYSADSSFFIKKKGKEIIDKFSYVMTEPQVETETGNFNVSITYTKPVTYINLDSLYIQLDSVNNVKFENTDLNIDELHRKITLTKTLDKKIFKQEEEPKLILYAGKGFLTTIEKDSSRMSKRDIISYWPELTGIIYIETQTSEQHFIIQLLNTKGQIIRSIRDTKKYSFKNLNPEDYQIRIIIDKNNNGQWDPGNILEYKEPEKILFYTTSEGNKKFPVRANWELGPLVLSF